MATPGTDVVTVGVTSDHVAEALVAAIPALRAAYDEERRQWGDEPPGPRVIFGDILNPYLLTLLHTGEQKATLRQIFAFLEELAQHEDLHIQELVAVTVCERLGDDAIALAAASRYMGAQTRQFSTEVEAFWGRRDLKTEAPGAPEP